MCGRHVADALQSGARDAFRLGVLDGARCVSHRGEWNWALAIGGRLKNKIVSACMKASVQSNGSVIMGCSDVIRWDDVVEVQNTDIKISKAVELGIEYGFEIASKMKEDLQSETGLLVTFPIAILMSELQKKLGSGEKVLELTGV